MTGRGVPQPSVGSLKPRFPGSPPQPAASTKQVLGPRPLQGMGRAPGESRCAHCVSSATGQEARRLIVTGRCSPARVQRSIEKCRCLLELRAGESWAGPVARVSVVVICPGRGRSYA
jgi:hypothetical protein